jgi:hypothetical protein
VGSYLLSYLQSLALFPIYLTKMNHTEKYLVVPFVKTIESPNESMVNNLDQNMSEIIEDKDLTDDDRMKLYYNNLNKFLLKYDPETHGIPPSLTKLAKID